MVSPLSFNYFHLLTYLVVDQPAGTGFSYTSTDRYVHTIDEVRCSKTDTLPSLRLLQAQEQLLEFLRNFYRVFPEYKNVDVCYCPVLQV